jgi:hypothetical protein
MVKRTYCIIPTAWCRELKIYACKIGTWNTMVLISLRMRVLKEISFLAGANDTTMVAISKTTKHPV